MMSTHKHDEEQSQEPRHGGGQSNQPPRQPDHGDRKPGDDAKENKPGHQVHSDPPKPADPPKGDDAA